MKLFHEALNICHKVIFRSNNKSTSTQPWRLFTLRTRIVTFVRRNSSRHDSFHILFLEARLFSIKTINDYWPVLLINSVCVCV